MSTNQTREEIIKILDRLPGETLEGLFEYLKQMEKNKKDEVQLSINVRKILNQDNELLQKLAQ